MLLSCHYLLSGIRHSHPPRPHMKWWSAHRSEGQRMKSSALLWATACLHCRSLELYWVSARALTLSISHHGSSQPSPPSGLISSLGKMYAQYRCSLLHFNIYFEKSQSSYLPFWPVLRLSTSDYCLWLHWGTTKDNLVNIDKLLWFLMDILWSVQCLFSPKLPFLLA